MARATSSLDNRIEKSLKDIQKKKAEVNDLMNKKDKLEREIRDLIKAKTDAAEKKLEITRSGRHHKLREELHSAITKRDKERPKLEKEKNLIYSQIVDNINELQEKVPMSEDASKDPDKIFQMLSNYAKDAFKEGHKCRKSYATQQREKEAKVNRSLKPYQAKTSHAKPRMVCDRTSRKGFRRAPPSYGRVKHARSTLIVWERTLLFEGLNVVSNNIKYLVKIIQSFTYVWFVPIQELNRLYHALHGNGILKKIYTEGMPRLPKGIGAPEEFINWYIDFEGWCESSRITPFVVGPLPNNPDEAEVDEGLRYLGEAIEDQNLRAAVIRRGAQNGAPNALAYLKSEFLQGIAEQPALNAILDNMALQSNESIIAFKARFEKIKGRIDPDPPAHISCTRFSNAIKRNTGSFFDDCISGTHAVNDMTNFDTFSTLLARLCTQKRSRETSLSLNPSSSTSQQISALTSKIDALAVNLSKRNPREGKKGRNNDRNGKGKEKSNDTIGGDKNKNRHPCWNCGQIHPGKCRKPPAKCDFVLPDGTTCGKAHLRKFCFYEDPSRCRDPKVRELVIKKLQDMKTASASAHHASSDNST